MEPNEIVFIPKYPFKYWAGFPLIFFMTVGCIWAILVFDERKWFFFICPFAGIFLPFAWRRTYKRIRFSSSIVLERFFIPPRIVEYSSIRDVGRGFLITTQGLISAGQCKNVDDFHAALEESRLKGRWSESQLEGKVQGRQRAQFKAFFTGFPISSIALLAMVYYRPFGFNFPFEGWLLIWMFFVCLPILLGLERYFLKSES